MKAKADNSDQKSTGYIYLHRSVMLARFFRDKFCKPMAWIDLLMLANHSEATIMVRAKPITLKRGQVGYSQESLAKRWKWSRQKVSGFLEYLENEHMVERVNEQVNKYLKSVITIVNYDYYQGEHLNGQVNRQLTNNSRTSHGTVTSNVSNESNESNNNASTSSARKKPRKKLQPVRDNPPTQGEILAYCDEQKFDPNYIDPKSIWDCYVTDREPDQQWIFQKSGKDVMNWKSLFRNIHDSNKTQGKIVSSNFVHDQSQLPDLAGKPKGTKYLDSKGNGRDANGNPTECTIY